MAAEGNLTLDGKHTRPCAGDVPQLYPRNLCDAVNHCQPKGVNFVDVQRTSSFTLALCLRDTFLRAACGPWVAV